MFAWFHALLPTEDRFFELAERHAALLILGAAALREMLDGGANVAPCSARIAQHETDADALTREVLLDVKRAFITPFERGDIQSLIASMDDAIDQMRKTTKLVMLYELTEFEPPMREMADIVIKAARLTEDMIKALRKVRENSHRLGALVEDVVRIEDEADNLHDKGLKALYHKSKTGDAMSYVVGSEIYSSLEKIMDRFEDVANGVNSIVIGNL
jgi:predicted phosphate transport protein (TIGR00153 family)